MTGAKRTAAGFAVFFCGSFWFVLELLLRRTQVQLPVIWAVVAGAMVITSAVVFSSAPRRSTRGEWQMFRDVVLVAVVAAMALPAVLCALYVALTIASLGYCGLHWLLWFVRLVILALIQFVLWLAMFLAVLCCGKCVANMNAKPTSGDLKCPPPEPIPPRDASTTGEPSRFSLLLDSAVHHPLHAAGVFVFVATVAYGILANVHSVGAAEVVRGAVVDWAAEDTGWIKPWYFVFESARKGLVWIPHGFLLAYSLSLLAGASGGLVVAAVLRQARREWMSRQPASAQFLPFARAAVDDRTPAVPDRALAPLIVWVGVAVGAVMAAAFLLTRWGRGASW